MGTLRAQAQRRTAYGCDVLDVLRDLVRAIHRHDPLTADHCVRSASYAFDIALYMGLPTRARRRVHQAALLHDIGKIGIPTAMLLKRAELTISEDSVMKLHPVLGASILSGWSATTPLMRIVMHHHERWDGTGYPAGLRGDDIPLESRIVLVADALDAMTVDRAYRPGRPFETAVAELAAEAGGQFDPDVVAAALEAYEERVLHAQRSPVLGG
jgi:HD-GYP domain-containing protein (c-di-GMP phosphodiesterase class II)